LVRKGCAYYSSLAKSWKREVTGRVVAMHRIRALDADEEDEADPDIEADPVIEVRHVEVPVGGSVLVGSMVCGMPVDDSVLVSSMVRGVGFEPTDDDVVVEETKKVRSKENLYRVSASLAKTVRLKLGPAPRATEANRLVAWELIVKECARRDIRRVDIFKFAVMAVDLVFVPSQDDLDAETFRTSVPVRERLAGDQPWGWNSIRKWIRKGTSGQDLVYRKT